MNIQHRDILTAIRRKQPITTACIAEYLMDHLGYGGGMDFDAFRDQVSKTIGYLKSKSLITGEDRPQAKGKPVRYWSLAYVPGSLDDPTVNPDFFKSKPHESIVETREPHAHDNADDAPQFVAADAIPLSNPPEAQAGWAPEAVADTSNVLGISIQSRDEAKAAKPATMPVSIALGEFCSYSWKEGISLAEVFMAGIAFAEEYHKIGPNENGDYL